MTLRKRTYLSEATSNKFIVVRTGHPVFDKIRNKTENDYYVYSSHKSAEDAEKKKYKIRSKANSSSVQGVRVVEVKGNMKLKNGAWLTKRELDGLRAV